jgi:hypothetical protein
VAALGRLPDLVARHRQLDVLGHDGEGYRLLMPNKPKQATSGTQEQPRFKRNRPFRSRLSGKDVGQIGD